MKLPRLWQLPFGQVPEVSPAELQRWLATDPGLQVVDARTGLEYAQGTIGRARHAPLTGMPSSMERLQLEPDRRVVVLCLSGHRSRPGVRWLRAQGYQAYSLKGGVAAWRMAGNPVDKPLLGEQAG